MKFLYPSFLWALFFIAIPVLIHILNLRKHKTVYFSNVDFLKKVKRETRKRSKIKQLIILACRVLAIVMLVLAFARPYKPAADADRAFAQQVTGIYIDNSFSMNSESPEGKAIENAKSKAYAIVQASKPDTRFALMTNEMDRAQSRLFTASEMQTLIGAVEAGYQQAKVSAVVQRFSDLTSNYLEQVEKNVYIISDFQKITTDLVNIEADTTITFNLVPIPINVVSNLAIDSCWFEAPSHYLKQQEELTVRIRNYSDEAYMQVPIKLMINDTLKSLATVDLEAGESREVNLAYSNMQTGFQAARVELSDYPIVYDNILYFSYQVAEQIKALLILPGRTASVRQRSIEALLAGDDFVQLDVETEDRLQISKLPSYATIFLNEMRSYSSGLIDALKSYVDNGGTLVFIPDQRGDINSYNLLLSALQCNTITGADTVSIPVSEVAYNHQVYQGVFREQSSRVDLPFIENRFRFTALSGIFETPLMSFADQTKALSVSTYGSGRVVVFAFQVSSEANRFTNHLLFVPTFYNLVLTSAARQQHFHYIEPGKPVTLNLPPDVPAQNPRMEHISLGETVFPEVRKLEGNRVNLFINESLKSGHYRLLMNDQLASVLSFNYNLSESDLQFYDQSELKAMMQQAGISKVQVVSGRNDSFMAAIEALYSGKQFWRLFVLFGLMFLLAESAVIRFWKG